MSKAMNGSSGNGLKSLKDLAEQKKIITTELTDDRAAEVERAQQEAHIARQDAERAQRAAQAKWEIITSKMIMTRTKLTWANKHLMGGWKFPAISEDIAHLNTMLGDSLASSKPLSQDEYLRGREKISGAITALKPHISFHGDEVDKAIGNLFQAVDLLSNLAGIPSPQREEGDSRPGRMDILRGRGRQSGGRGGPA